MENKNANWLMASIVVFTFLVFPIIAQSDVCGAIDTSRAVPELGYAWNTSQKFYMPADSSSYPNVSPLRIFENGVELGPAHSYHADIRANGAGRFSYWNGLLYFSTSDNSDPRTNGRIYEYSGTCMPTFTVTKVDDVQTVYGTFQSHNQKLVQNAYGLFMTYSYAPDGDTSGSEAWRLARSLDGGRTWATIWRGMTPTRPPVLETDAHGSIFVIAPDARNNFQNPATFYRFDPESSFSNPRISALPGASAGKSTSYWDETRKQLYFATWGWWGTPPIFSDFYVLDRDGNIISSRTIAKHHDPSFTDLSFMHYPHLVMDGSRLYFAWTTTPDANAPDQLALVTPAVYPVPDYRAIHYIYSDDGGVTWSATSSSGPLSLPILPDERGPATMVNLQDEIDAKVDTWLSNFVAKGGSLHFAYHAHGGDPGEGSLYRQHYMRFAPNSGVREIDIQPTWPGQYISIANSSGFFATESANTTPLFMVSTSDNRLGILKSSDNGQSWSDQAISSNSIPAGRYWYAISGNRHITKTGQIIGHFTEEKSDGSGPYSVNFFSVPVVDRSTDPNALWTFVAMDATKATPDGGYGFRLPITAVEFGSDTLQNLSYSKLRLFENGVEKGPAHSYHADIRSSGAGRFSHWTNNTLYFSASDNSDPRTNGKTYQVAFPSTEASGLVFYGKINPSALVLEQGYAYASSQFFGTDGDSANNPSGSRLMVYEDGTLLGPAHSSLATVRATGNGAYLHSENTLYFSASDNTDPRTNGRSYTFAIQGGTVSAVGEDLSITVSASSNSVFIGDYITYTITVTNNGPAMAHGVTVIDNLGSATFAPVGSSTNCTGTASVNCTIGDLANGASTTLTIVARPDTVGTLTNSVKAAETNLFDPTPANNTASTTTTIQGLPDLTVTTVTGPNNANAGSNITISTATANPGTATAAASVTGLYLSTDATITNTDTRLGARSIPSLTTGDTNSGSTSVTLPTGLVTGLYYLGAIADDTGLITEGNPSGSSETNNAKTGNTLQVNGVPKTPSSLSATVNSRSRITLTWTDNASDETGFRIERSTNGTSFSQIATVSANVKTYVNSNLNPNTLYYYRVRAYNNRGNSGYSNVVSGRTSP